MCEKNNVLHKFMQKKSNNWSNASYTTAGGAVSRVTDTKSSD